MFLEALGASILGLALAGVAALRLPHRLPSRALVLPTGAAGGLFGGLVAHSALGPGHAMTTLIGALAVAAALLSLLLRTGRLRPSAPTA
jgi:hypothetical protein